MKLAYLVIPLACGLLAGCVENQPQPTYYQPSVQQSYVRIGTIVGVRTVAVSNTNQNNETAGTLIGAAAGAVIGSQIGEGGGKTAATIVGAGAGALVGNQIAKQNTAQVTYRRAWTVRLDQGGTLTILQDSNRLRVGERVRVVGRGNNLEIQRY